MEYILSYLLFISFWAFSLFIKSNKHKELDFNTNLLVWLIFTVGWGIMILIIKLWQN